MLVRMQTNYTMYTLLVGMWNGTFIFKRLAFSFKVNLYLPWAYDTATALLDIYSRNIKTGSHKNLYMFLQ